MSTNIEKAIEILNAHEGILRSSEAQKLGIHPQTLSRMHARGLIVREERGLYRLPDREIEADPDLVTVAKLVPKGVFCLLTALDFHGLTSQIPRRIYVALPFGYKAPSISSVPTVFVNLSDKPYHAGIEEHNLDGVIVSIYDAAKTVADCFKFRRTIGEDVAIEALKDYLQSRDRIIRLLLEHARIDRVENVMQPYLKALL